MDVVVAVQREQLERSAGGESQKARHVRTTSPAGPTPAAELLTAERRWNITKEPKRFIPSFPTRNDRLYECAEC